MQLPDWIVPEARRGRPGLAAEAALRAADAYPDDADDHRVEAACALLVAGEPRAAGRVLDTVTVDDPRLVACRVWVSTLERHWYPGGIGGEFEQPWDTLPGGPYADDEAGRLATLVAGAVGLHDLRTLAENLARYPDEQASEMLAIGALNVDHVAALPVAGAESWALEAAADLDWRAGGTPPAHAGSGDSVSRAVALMMEGDRYAAPGSSPEALGYSLADHSRPSPRAGERDIARARTLYQQAVAIAVPANTPRLAGALALRRGLLAWFDGDTSDQLRQLAAAAAAFADAGDAAGAHTVAVHRVLAELRAGPVASVRLRSGTNWDLRARGAVADVEHWARARGSACYALGLGRLLQRAAEEWQTAGDGNRAAVALSMSVPLQGLAGPWHSAPRLCDLAALDNARQLPVRALARLEQARRLVPPVVNADDRVTWVRSSRLISEVMLAHSLRARTSTAGRGINGFARAIEHTRRHASLVGVPTEDVVESMTRYAPQKLADLQGRIPDGPQGDPLAYVAQTMRETVRNMDALLAMQRGVLAMRAGDNLAADRHFSQSIAAADAAGPELEWVAVVAYSRWRKYADAQIRLRTVREYGLVPVDRLATLALGARAFDVARAAFDALPAPVEWNDLADRGELALESDDAAGAIALCDRAIARLEAIVAAMPRDADRLGHTDDGRVVRLYLLAARAALALGEPARALQYADRLGTLTMASQVADAEQLLVDDGLRRHWQQAATEWSAAFERVLDAYETGGHPDARAAELARADDALIGLEADLEVQRPGALASTRRLGAPPDWDTLREGLPNRACVVQYLLHGHDLLAFAMTRSRVVGRRINASGSGVERRVREFWEGCANGTPGAVAGELAALLLDPVADVLRTCDRVIVVSSGAFSAVAFHALPFDGRPLGADHVVSYLPASSLLESQIVDAPISGSSVVAVGDPAFDPELYPGLARLPGAGLEARNVGRRWQTDAVLLDAAATEAAVREAVKGRSIVHLAAHGHLDDVAPSLSSLVLAGADELTVADLIGLRLNAELAVLSACDSGRGVATLGGDVIGLTRGLITAGVRRAVVSLWPVDDRAAAVTMDAFHSRLAAGHAPGAALAEAQADVRALSAGSLTARYVALGGSAPSAAARRGAPARSARYVTVDPRLIDPPLEPAGPLELIWAPFILVGA